jgi:hypothetical protein
MGDDNSKIIIDVLLNQEDAAKRAKDLTGDINKIQAAQKALADSNKKNSASYVENAKELSNLRQEQKAYVAIQASAAGSNNQLRAQLLLLTNQYNALSKAERDGTTTGTALTTQIRSISDELKRNESAVGDNRRNVANYTESIKAAHSSNEGFGSSVRNVIQGFLPFGPAMSNVNAQFTNFVAGTRTVIAGFQSLETIQNKAIIATEAEIVTRDALAAAEERLAATEAELATLRQTSEATAVELSIANQALTVATLELNAAEQAQLVTQEELAAAQLALAARTSANTTSVGASFTSMGGIIGTVMVAAGYAVYKFASQYDSFSDNIEQISARYKAGFTQIGAAIKGALTGDGLKGFTLIGKAADDAANATDALQKIQDRVEINSQQNQQVQNQVSLYRLQARNRSLDNEDRQRYLDKADKLERDQQSKTVKLHEDSINETVAYAKKVNDVSNFGKDTSKKLTEDDLKELRKGNIDRANILLNADKITKEAYDSLKQRYAERTADQQQANSALEKIQNDQDKYAQQAEAAAQKASGAERKRNEENLKARQEYATSLLNVAKLTLTERQEEFTAINSDIDKRIEVYKKYGQVTTQLEVERTARIAALNKKFSEEDTATITDALGKATEARIAAMASGWDKEESLQNIKNERELASLDKQILERNARVLKGEEDKNGILDALFAERQAIAVRQQQESFDQIARAGLQEDDAQRAAYQQNLDDQQAAKLSALDIDKQIAEARLGLDNAVLTSAQDLSGTVVDLLGKNTIAGKIAFGFQKALAIAQIIINAELEKSAINAAASFQAQQYSAIPIIGPGLAAGVLVLAGLKTAAITAREVASSAIIAATTVGTLIAGKAKGGIQGLDYVSDGKGTILPGYAKQDNLNAYLRSGEAVIVSEAVQDPHTRNLLSTINQLYGGRSLDGATPSTSGYALGGTYAGGFAQKAGNDIANQMQTANLLRQVISDLKIYTVVTDVTDAQSKQAKVIQNATF